MSWSTWNYAESTTITIPTHAKGDLIVIAAARGDSGALATIPAGWLVANARSLNSPTKSFVLAYKVAASAAETSGTWTNAQLLACGVWSDTTVYTLAGNASNANGAANATVNYAAIVAASATSAGAIRMQSASAVIIGAAFAKQINSGIESPPSGMALVANGQGASANQIAIHETTAAVSSYNSTNVAVGSNIDWMTLSVERIDTGYAEAAGGGMLIHPGMSGGMRG